MGRSRWLVVGTALLAACGGGGTGGSGAQAGGPLHWSVPFVPSVAAAFEMSVSLRNLENEDTTATLQGYKPDGMPYTGPVFVTLDGNDEHRLTASEALGGDEPEGGFVLVTTLSAQVEVAYLLRAPGFSEEASRGVPLRDLVVLMPPYEDAVSIGLATRRIQVSNPTGLPITVFATAYVPGDEFDDDFEDVPLAPILLAPFETKTFTPEELTGFGPFFGGVEFASASPFSAATDIGASFLAIGTQRDVERKDRTESAVVSFGLETAVPVSYTDFILQLHNTSGDPQMVTLLDVALADGTQILIEPRLVEVPAHASREFGTIFGPFGDLFGDATLESFLTTVRFTISVPKEVEASFVQFDPVFLTNAMTIKPHVVGHLFATVGVEPEPLPISPAHNFADVMNPATVPVTVNLRALIPQDDDVAAAFFELGQFVVPARGFVRIPLDVGAATIPGILDIPVLGFQFRSPSPFAVTAHREARTPNTNLLVLLSPHIVRNYDDAE